MNTNYVVDNTYLAQRGLDLNDYALDGTFIPAIIQLGLDLAITRISYLNDEVKGETEVETFLDKNPNKVETFKKLQYRVIYNLIYQAETSPTDKFVDDIIVHELKVGKINSTQYGYFNEPKR